MGNERMDNDALKALHRRLRQTQSRPRNYNIDFGDEWPYVAATWAKIVNNIYKTRFPDEDCMRVMGVDRDIPRLFERVGMTEFLHKRPQTVNVLVLEFLCTLMVRKEKSVPTSISFKLLGEAHTLKTYEVNTILGAPRDEEGVLIREDPRFNHASFWRDITDTGAPHQDEYKPSRAKTTAIRNPTIRYLEKILANTIFARSESGAVSKDELYVLWCFLHGVRFNAGVYFINQLERIKCRSSARIYIGGLITLIAESFGIVVEEGMSGDDLDITQLVKMHVLERVSSRWCFKQDGGKLFPLPNRRLTTVFGERCNWTLRGDAHMEAIRAFEEGDNGANGQLHVEEDEAEVEEHLYEEAIIPWQANYRVGGTTPHQDAHEWRLGQDEWNAMNAKVNSMFEMIRAIYQDRFPATPLPPPTPLHAEDRMNE